MSRIAVLNAGTATLKLAVLEAGADSIREEHRTEQAWPETEGLDAAVGGALERRGPFDAIGHRVVHGGSSFREAVRLDAAVEGAIAELIPLAPLHNARALAAIGAARRAFPGVPAFAVFDTAFHADRPAASMCYALPAQLVAALGLRRYGFHGIAHAALTESLAAALGRPPSQVAAVTLQLGSGCSACAVENGRSIETSMGYTPLEGLVMPRRSGDVDPAAVLQLARAGHSLDEIEHRLTREAGLLALAGSSDVREILAAEARGDAGARLALEVFVRRIVMTAGSYFTLLRGRGALVFGGGIGTHSAEIRRRVAAGLEAFEVEIDPALNAANAPGRISRADRRDVFAFRTDEEHIIAREVARAAGIPATRTPPGPPPEPPGPPPETSGDP